MNSVSPAGATTGAANASSGDAIVYVTPDALLEYCQLQLGSLDNEVTDEMNTQRSQLTERQAVEKVQSTLESFGSQGPQGSNVADQMRTCVQAFDQAIASLPPGDPIATQLQQQRDTMVTKYGYQAPVESSAGGAVTTVSPAQVTNPPANDDWNGTTSSIDNLVQSIKSNADIGMLKLQDLVSQREQAVQLVSGMMSKEDQTLESQAKAIGS